MKGNKYSRNYDRLEIDNYFDTDGRLGRTIRRVYGEHDELLSTIDVKDNTVDTGGKLDNRDPAFYTFEIPRAISLLPGNTVPILTSERSHVFDISAKMSCDDLCEGDIVRYYMKNTQILYFIAGDNNLYHRKMHYMLGYKYYRTEVSTYNIKYAESITARNNIRVYVIDKVAISPLSSEKKHSCDLIIEHGTTSSINAYMKQDIMIEKIDKADIFYPVLANFYNENGKLKEDPKSELPVRVITNIINEYKGFDKAEIKEKLPFVY